MLLKTLLLYAVLIGLIPNVMSIEPVTTVLGFGAVASVVYGIAKVSCLIVECCQDRWIVNNMTALRLELDRRLYGQHLVQKAVTKHIQGHVQRHHLHKALALSFHGSTGTGKNHVSRIIAEALYAKGLDSGYVKLIVVTSEFPHHHMLPVYRDKLKNMIEAQVKKCPQSMFIFDEIDKMPSGLIDTVKPYVDYHESLDNVDYRRAIFIFLSNTGGPAITEHVLQRWRDGARREEIGLSEVENVLARAAVNSESKGGLWHSEIVTKHLMTAFIPFLPLERSDVRRCIRDMMVVKRHYASPRHVPKEKVEEVMAELTFYPQKEHLFSVTGCKRVAEKVDYVML